MAQRDIISHSQWVLLFRVASAGTKSRVLVLFGYAQTALNADATFKFCCFPTKIMLMTNSCSFCKIFTPVFHCTPPPHSQELGNMVHAVGYMQFCLRL